MIYIAGIRYNIKMIVVSMVYVCLFEKRSYIGLDIILVNVILIFINLIPFNNSDGKHMLELFENKVFKVIYYIEVFLTGVLIAIYMRGHI